MKIAVLVNDITGVGGVERVVSNTSNIFVDELNYDIDIISIFGNKNIEPKFNLNKKINLIEIKKEDNIKARVHNFLVIYKSLSILLKKKEYDVILCCSISISLLALLAKKNNKLVSSIIAWEHSQYDNTPKELKYIRSKTYRFLDGIVTLSEKDKKILEKYNKNTVCIYNIISHNLNVQSKLSTKKIIAVGRLESEKGFDMLIQAFKLISTNYEDWTLEIFGEGSQRENLNKQIDNYGLNKHVKLKGITQNILLEYTNSSIFVLSSRSESFGMVLVEAMSCGLPCVSFDCNSGPREIINNNIDGLLAENGNVKDLANKLSKLIENKKYRVKLGKRAKVSSERFLPEHILKEWEAFFSALN